MPDSYRYGVMYCSLRRSVIFAGAQRNVMDMCEEGYVGFLFGFGIVMLMLCLHMCNCIRNVALVGNACLYCLYNMWFKMFEMRIFYAIRTTG